MTHRRRGSLTYGAMQLRTREELLTSVSVQKEANFGALAGRRHQDLHSMQVDAAIAQGADVTDEEWMRQALVLADRAAALGEVPVGSVLIDPSGALVASGHNLRETDADPTAHAEIVALRAGARARGTWRLEGYTLFVTLEPCAMCAGALVNARIERVVWGCDDPKAGACSTLYTIGQDVRLNHRFAMTRGVLETECAARLKHFFASLRAQGKQGPSKDV